MPRFQLALPAYPRRHFKLDPSPTPADPPIDTSEWLPTPVAGCRRDEDLVWLSPP